CMLVGEVAYQRLTPELRAALDRAARDMEAELRPKVIADDAAVMQQVRAKRIVVSEVDKVAFSATVKT
ncbi:hypothetical protein, partial [Escherichia coli]|uniref:hypothetical protein n=1 Tax=Escherichia coli TaxID=562 RepID=UPI0013D8CF93